MERLILTYEEACVILEALHWYGFKALREAKSVEEYRRGEDEIKPALTKIRDYIKGFDEAERKLREK